MTDGPPAPARRGDGVCTISAGIGRCVTGAADALERARRRDLSPALPTLPACTIIASCGLWCLLIRGVAAAVWLSILMPNPILT